MNSAVVRALAATPDLLWGLVESELAAHAEAKESWARERLGWERERLVADALARAEYAALQHKLDCALGLMSVRTVLEQVGREFAASVGASQASKKSSSRALSEFCKQPRFVAYLVAVGAATGIADMALTEGAQSAYGLLSAEIHHGSAGAGGSDAVPADVFPNNAVMYAVAAIFKFARRDLRLYALSLRDVPALPTPECTPPQSAPSSATPTAAPSPPRDGASGAGAAAPDA